MLRLFDDDDDGGGDDGHVVNDGVGESERS